MELEPGWLGRQFDRTKIDVATWPEYMQTDPEWDKGLTPEQRKEAARRLRARADKLDPPPLSASEVAIKFGFSKPSAEQQRASVDEVTGL